MSLINRFDQLAAPPVFIVGSARSGTTWVKDIYAAHPQVAGVMESWLFTEHAGLGALFTAAHQYSGRGRGLGRLMSREDAVALVRQTAEMAFSAAMSEESRFFVEKSPSHLFTMPLIAELFPDARFVHVIRDGRDVAVSVRAAVKSWMPKWGSSFGASVLASATAWRDAIQTARVHCAEMNERFLEIRYETIKKDPFASYRRLFDFGNMPYDEGLLQHIFDQTDFDQNFKGNEEGFRRGGRVGDWQTQMSLWQRWQFDRVAGEMLVGLGYAVDRRWWWLGQRRAELPGDVST